MYFQTWMHWCKTRKIPWFGERIYRGGQRLCGKLIGHRASKTEWGYGGGSHADVWCRWCNQMGSIPLADLDKRYENARTTIWNFTACDIRHKEWKPETPNDALRGAEPASSAERPLEGTVMQYIGG